MDSEGSESIEMAKEQEDYDGSERSMVEDEKEKLLENRKSYIKEGKKKENCTIITKMKK